MSDQQYVHLNSLKHPTIITTQTNQVSPLWLKDYLYSLLIPLERISQNPRYHPEGNVLYHSLQVFQLAHQSCEDPEFWAAALLHDIGKVTNRGNHAERGAMALEGILSPRIVWLVRHHLHLLMAPKSTRRWLHHTPQLKELELLRAWDLKGRSPNVTVIQPSQAINQLIANSSFLLPISIDYYENKVLR